MGRAEHWIRGLSLLVAASCKFGLYRGRNLAMLLHAVGCRVLAKSVCIHVWALVDDNSLHNVDVFCMTDTAPSWPDLSKLLRRSSHQHSVIAYL